MFMFSSSIHIMVGSLILSNVISKTSSSSVFGKYWNFFGFPRLFEEEKDIVFDEEEDDEEEDIIPNSINPEEINPEELCYICYQEKLTVKLQPCGHMIGNFCANFVEQTTTKQCPTCRHNITQFENLEPLNDQPGELFKKKYYSEADKVPRELLDVDYNNLMERVSRLEISVEEIKARYCYLRRSQAVDEKLLEEISSLMNYREYSRWKEFKIKVLSLCSTPVIEHKLYTDTFQRTLSIKEKHMIKRYYERQNFKIKREFMLRENYMKP